MSKMGTKWFLRTGRSAGGGVSAAGAWATAADSSVAASWANHAWGIARVRRAQSATGRIQKLTVEQSMCQKRSDAWKMLLFKKARGRLAKYFPAKIPPRTRARCNLWLI